MAPRRLIPAVAACAACITIAALVVLHSSEHRSAPKATVAWRLPLQSARVDPDAASAQPQPAGDAASAAGEQVDAQAQITAQFYRDRAYPAKAIPAAAYLHAKKQASALPAAPTAPSGAPETSGGAAVSGAPPTSVITWASFGPRAITAGTPSIYNGSPPWSGRVTTIAHDPTNAAIAYAGGAEGGVWKTTNSGTNWAPILAGVPSQAVGAITVDPNAPSTVYVGTGEANGCCDSYFGVGIYKSTNGGTSWSKIGGTTFNACHVSDIVVAPGDSSLVLASVSNSGKYTTACNSGIYRSTDAGATWSYRVAGIVEDLANKPGSASVFYAGATGSGVWRSTDGGQSWFVMAGGLPTSNVGRVALATSAASPGRLYAVIGKAGTAPATLGSYSSIDSGTTWTTLPYSNYCAYTQAATSGQCNYDLTATALPTNSAYLYVGGIRVQRYDGSSWTTLGYDGVNTTGIHVDIHSLSFDSSNRLWVGSDGGAYRKDSGVSAFANLNATLSLTQFTFGATGAPASAFASGTQDNGTLYYDSTNGWDEFQTGDGGPTAFDLATGTYWSEYVLAQISRADSSNTCVFGLQSEPSANSCTTRVADGAEFYAPFVQSPAAKSTLFVGTQRVWRTVNGGTNWTAFSPVFPGYVEAIGPSKSNTSVTYAAWSRGSGGTTVHVTTDGGATWPQTAALPNRIVSDIQVKSSAPNVAWVTLSGYNSTTPTAPGHVFLTQDSGTTWTNISGNLPDAPINAIDVDSRTSPSTLYVATDVGVFWSIDGGATWANTSKGLPATIAMDVHADTASETLVLATHGRGAYQTPLPSAKPVISSLSPTSGPVGTVVTITGKNLTYVQSVLLNALPCAFTVVSKTQLRVTIPVGATGGPFVVRSPGGAATSASSFTVT